MKHFIFFATIVFFPIYIATVVKQTNSFNASTVLKCLLLQNLAE